MNDSLPPLPRPEFRFRYSDDGNIANDFFSPQQMRDYAAQAVAAERDCRTCRHFREAAECHSVLRCVAGSSYQRAGVVKLWDAAP